MVVSNRGDGSIEVTGQNGNVVIGEDNSGMHVTVKPGTGGGGSEQVGIDLPPGGAPVQVKGQGGGSQANIELPPGGAPQVQVPGTGGSVGARPEADGSVSFWAVPTNGSTQYWVLDSGGSSVTQF